MICSFRKTSVPDGLIARDFRLTPLGPQHNEADYAAWTQNPGRMNPATTVAITEDRTSRSGLWAITPQPPAPPS